MSVACSGCQDLSVTHTCGEDPDAHIAVCDRCKHWCGWCYPLQCDYGPAPRSEDLVAHIQDVGESYSEPPCYPNRESTMVVKQEERPPSAHELLEMAEQDVRQAASSMMNLANDLLAQNKIDKQEHAHVWTQVIETHGALDNGRY